MIHFRIPIKWGKGERGRLSKPKWIEGGFESFSCLYFFPTETAAGKQFVGGMEQSGEGFSNLILTSFVY